MTDLVCPCVKKHSPKAYVTALHHVIPRSWGGQTVPGNLEPLCPNSHTAVHRLLDEYVKAGGPPSSRVAAVYGAHVKQLAARGWAGRPAHPTPTSMEHP